MYYIIKTDSLFGMGGESASVSICKKSEDKNKLLEILLDKFNKAIDDEDVEFINDYEREDAYKECIYEEEELTIKYFSDGCDTLLIKYDIVSDEKVEEV